MQHSRHSTTLDYTVVEVTSLADGPQEDLVIRSLRYTTRGCVQTARLKAPNALSIAQLARTRRLPPRH